jgi:hypothetical protein
MALGQLPGAGFTILRSYQHGAGASVDLRNFRMRFQLTKVRLTSLIGPR